MAPLPSSVRVLLANNHCISDPTAGVTQSLRTIVEWLAEAGHECRVLTTSRFESAVTFSIAEHLQALGVAMPAGAPQRGGRGKAGGAVIRYQVGQVPVTLLLTRHHDERRPDAREAREYLSLAGALIDELRPDLLIACNGHPMIRETMARARAAGAATAFAVRGFGYYDPRYFEHVDHVFTCSAFLTDHYRERIGIESTPLEPPIDWSKVVGPADARAFVTFVNPSRHKGLLLFARLADMLGARRPDIPVLIVQSGHSAGSLTAIPGFDFSRYPQIMAAPPVPQAADYLALTRLLLVPSVWPEPFGRVAAEAMIAGIPPLVSDRGSLPWVVGGDAAQGGGGRVLPIPSWMTEEGTAVPAEAEVEPWFAAICELWDDADAYARLAARARALAAERYSEDVSRTKHVRYFAALRPGGTPFGAPGTRSPAE